MEIDLSFYRVKNFIEQENSDHLRSKLDPFEEARERAWIKMASYQQRIAHYYNLRVKLKTFRCGDLMPRWVKVSKSIEQDKLAPN